MTGSHTQGRVPPRAHHGPEVVRAGEPQARRPRPPAGECLVEGIDAVLPLLTTRPPAVTVALVEDLRAALARTAARGDTCRVHAAAESVRQAVDLLLAGSTEAAGEALRRARAVLTSSR